MNEKVRCIILGTIDDDPNTTWEIASILEQRLKIEYEEISKLILEELQLLLDEGLALAYVGTNFTGEERELPGFTLTADFVEEYRNDWKTKAFGDIDYRFFITERGLEFYLKRCKPEYFE
jgi:hypothetical protein